MATGITVRLEGPICTLEIDNREKRNALTNTLVRELVDELEALADSDGVRAVVVRGAGENAFCSGYDVSKLDEDVHERGEQLRRMADAIYHHPCPTIAMINGAAIGAGFMIATACDVRIAVESARFGVPAARLGAIYTGRGIQLAREVVGTAHTKELLFVAENVDAGRAEEMGLVTHVVERDELAERTYGIAERIATNAPISLTGTKQIIHALEAKTSFTDAEEDWIAGLRDRAAESRDHEEGRRAFAENREPEFEGR